MSAPLTTAMSKSIGVLGGAFDPVHNAHLAIARAALERLSLAQVRWIPSGTPPHRTPALATAAQRMAMLHLATSGEPRFLVDARETRKTAPGYTVETLEELHAELGAGVELVLLIGADQYARLETWHRWQDLYSLARVAVFARPGLETTPSSRAEFVPLEPLDISSSAIRSRIAAGTAARGLLPDAVLDYIDREHLYRHQPDIPVEHRTR